MSDSNKNNNAEQSFTIQPHPATTNDPNTDPALNSSLKDSAFGAANSGKPGPQIFDASKLEEPLSKEELAKRSAELNKD